MPQLRERIVGQRNQDDPNLIEFELFRILTKLETEDSPEQIEVLEAEYETMQNKLAEKELDIALTRLSSLGGDPTKSIIPDKMKEKVKEFMKELLKNITSFDKLMEDVSLVGLSYEDKKELVNVVSTSIRKYIIEMLYTLIIIVLPNFPGAGPIKKAAELTMKFRDDTSSKIEGARLRRDMDTVLKNIELIKKSLSIGSAVSAKRYNAGRLIDTLEPVSDTTESVPEPTEDPNPHAAPPTGETAPVLQMPMDPESLLRVPTGGGRIKLRTKNKKKKKTKRRKKTKRKKIRHNKKTKRH
jgi:hypothetical protein